MFFFNNKSDKREQQQRRKETQFVINGSRAEMVTLFTLVRKSVMNLVISIQKVVLSTIPGGKISFTVICTEGLSWFNMISIEFQTLHKNLKLCHNSSYVSKKVYC